MFDIMSLMNADPNQVDMLAAMAAEKMPPPQLGAPGGAAVNPFGSPVPPQTPVPVMPSDQMSPLPPPAPAEQSPWDKVMNPPSTPPFVQTPSPLPPEQATALPQRGVGLTAEQAALLQAQGKQERPPQAPAASMQRSGPVNLSNLTLPGAPQQMARPTLAQLLNMRG